MHYYVYSALVFKDGKIVNACNRLYKSDKPSTIVEFKKDVARDVAGVPSSYSAIIIVSWNEIDEPTHRHIEQSDI